MITMEMFEKEPSKYVWLNSGKIVYDSIFAKEFDGDLKLLLDCIEDNIVEGINNPDMIYTERINYYQVIKDYHKENKKLEYDEAYIEECRQKAKERGTWDDIDPDRWLRDLRGGKL